MIVWSMGDTHTVFSIGPFASLTEEVVLIDDGDEWRVSMGDDSYSIIDPDGDPLTYLSRLFAPTDGPPHDPNQPVLTYAYGTARFDVWGVTE